MPHLHAANGSFACIAIDRCPVARTEPRWLRLSILILLCRLQTRGGWIGAYKYSRRCEQCTRAFWAELKSCYDARLGIHVGTLVATPFAATSLCSSCRHGLNSFKFSSGSLLSERRQLSHARSSPVTQPLSGLISGTTLGYEVRRSRGLQINL